MGSEFGGVGMRVSNLIRKLKSLQTQHGDIQVKLNTDHGQHLMESNWCGVTYVKEDDLNEYMIDEYYEDSELEGLDSEGVETVKVIEIQGY